MENILKKTVLIGDAARICRVTIKQLRHWQDKGYIRSGPRIVCGERAYRQFEKEDLEVIRSIKEYLDQGYTLKTAAGKAAGKINEVGGEING